MTKESDEISVFFYCPESLLNDFQEATRRKGKSLGIELNKKQAYNLALKEITDKWNKENPGD